ncbi:MAG: site-2 protease family protein [Ignavibacteriales bacterium]|nr:site-2 protease family protein [Ignavibacteriales bacterium]
MPDIQINEKLITFVLFLPLFLISLAVHEFAHAFSAFKFGDDTAKNSGRLTLNPFKHLDLVGSIIMPLISFASGGFIIGWAKPVPVNPNNFSNKRRDDAIVSFAGPLSNLILAVLFFIAYFFIAKSSDNPTENFQRILTALHLGGYFNIFLFAFNLLPIPPLDGSHILYDIFPNRIIAGYLNAGMYGFLILLVFIYSPLWGYFVKFVNFIYEILISIIGKA